MLVRPDDPRLRGEKPKPIMTGVTLKDWLGLLGATIVMIVQVFCGIFVAICGLISAVITGGVLLLWIGIAALILAVLFGL